MFNKDHKLSLARFGMILVLLAGMLAATPVSQVRAATLTVTTTSDSGPGSLRQAMMDAASGTTIRFDPSLAGQTITLSTPVNLTNKRLILDGSGLSPQVTISGRGFNLNWANCRHGYLRFDPFRFRRSINIPYGYDYPE